MRSALTRAEMPLDHEKGAHEFSGPQSLRVYLANGVLAARCETRTIAAEDKAAQKTQAGEVCTTNAQKVANHIVAAVGNGTMTAEQSLTYAWAHALPECLSEADKGQICGGEGSPG